MATSSLNASSLKSLKAPTTGVLELWDEKSSGLCLRVFPSGRAVWTFRYRPKNGGGRRRIGLGAYPTVGLSEARRRADKHRGAVADGKDPQADQRAQRSADLQNQTLGAIADEFLKERPVSKQAHGKKRSAIKASTLALYKHYLTKLVPAKLRGKKALAVEQRDIEQLHQDVGKSTPVTANRLVAALSGVYTFAATKKHVPQGFNPAHGIDKFEENGRERYLSSAELLRLGTALRQAATEGLPWAEGTRGKHDRKPENRRTVLPPHVVGAIRLLLFTGCRLREILDLRWSEVDLERGLVFLPDSKTGRKTVVLNAPALQIISGLPRVGAFVIAGNSDDKPRSDLKKPWELLKRHAALEGVRLHDLRHTHASVGVGGGMGLPIVGKLLGHKHAKTTERYAHLDADPLRRASDRIGGEIATALGDQQPADNVHFLGRKIAG